MSDAFDFSAVLRGPTVTARPIRESDREPMFVAASDPAIWVQHPDPMRYTDSGFTPYFEGALASGSAFAFVDNESGAIVGSSRYYGHDKEAREIEIGWTFLVRACWGGSVNREIKTLMLEHAFQFVDTVVFWVGKDNVRSRKAMEKIGGILREGLFHRGPTDDDPHVVYEVTAKSWSA